MRERFDYETASKVDYEFLKHNSRLFRSHPTEAEETLWKYLRKNKLGIRFRRQHIICNYIADFVCLRAKLVVELDGGYHFIPKQQRADAERTANLESKGYKVLRFKNYEVEENPSHVADVIFDETVNRLRTIQ